MTEQEYNDTLDRIVKGAEFIETLSKDDPKYKPAMDKYDKLVDQVQQYQKQVLGYRTPWEEE